MKEYQRIITAKSIPNIIDPERIIENWQTTLIKWDTYKRNASGNNTLDTAKALLGTQSLKIDTGATNPTNTDYNTISRTVFIPKSRNIKMTLIFNWSTYGGSGSYILFEIIRSTLPNKFEIGAVIGNDTTTGNLKISLMDQYGGAGIVAAITTAPIQSAIWYKVEFEVDLVTVKYTALRINNREFNVSNITAKQPVDFTRDEPIIINLVVGNGQTQQNIVNIDYIAVEPAES